MVFCSLGWGGALMNSLLYPVACFHGCLASTTSLYQYRMGFLLFSLLNTTTSLRVPHVCPLLLVPSHSHTIQQNSCSSLHVLCHCNIPQISCTLQITKPINLHIRFLVCLTALIFLSSPQTQSVLFYLQHTDISYTLHSSPNAFVSILK